MKITNYQAQGPRLYQEDRLFISENTLAVFDGHGGSECADYCVNRLLSLTTIFKLEKTPIKAIEHICRILADECKNMKSGAAFSIVHKSGNMVTVGILGDAPVIITDANDQVNISPEHNVRSNKAEAQAAIARGGDLYNGYICNRYGAGLQMSRALGDCAMGEIISNIPEIYEVTIGAESVILVATDGVVDPSHKDKWAYDAIVSLLRSGADAKQIVNSVKLQDNATAIVCYV